MLEETAIEISTYTLTTQQLRDELEHLVQYFLDKNIHECEILFGAFWGSEIYPGDEWYYMGIQIDTLLEKIDEVEKEGKGKLSKNDLYIRFCSIPILFRFCNDSDIHILIDEPNDIARYFYDRWNKLGYKATGWRDNKIST